MKNLISSYLEAKESAWALSTWKSEKSRLKAIAGQLDKSPKDLHAWCKEQKLKPYTIKTLFIRLADLEAWSKKDFGYKEYLTTHRNRFKHVYQKEEINLTYGEALECLRQLDESSRKMSEGLLNTGCRLHESYALKDGRVEGKGNKTRKIFGTIEVTVPKSTLARKLKAVGLKPHMLRKLCATRLAEKGATAADLCKVFGWSSIATAYQYLQPKDDERLAALMETSSKD